MELSLKMPATEEVIKTELAKIRSELARLQGEVDLLGEAICFYQKQCKHPGQHTGHNDRDGSWGAPCPVCGYSY